MHNGCIKTTVLQDVTSKETLTKIYLKRHKSWQTQDNKKSNLFLCRTCQVEQNRQNSEWCLSTWCSKSVWLAAEKCFCGFCFYFCPLQHCTRPWRMVCDRVCLLIQILSFIFLKFKTFMLQIFFLSLRTYFEIQTFVLIHDDELKWIFIFFYLNIKIFLRQTNYPICSIFLRW
jgi:hypothetical protein